MTDDDIRAALMLMRQRAVRAHQICNLLRIAYPEIGELADDGCLHEAIHDILRVQYDVDWRPEGCSDG